MKLSALLLESTLSVKECFTYIAVSGTKVNLNIRQVITSMIGKHRDLDLFAIREDAMPESSFLSSMEELLSFLDLHVKKEKIDFQKYQKHLYPLLGRRRLAANFLGYFFDNINIPNWTEMIESIVEKSVKLAYNDIVTSLTKSFLNTWDGNGKIHINTLTKF